MVWPFAARRKSCVGEPDITSRDTLTCTRGNADNDFLR